MQAMVYHAYGSPDELHLEEVAKPIPKADEVLVKVHAASINAADSHRLGGESLVVRLMIGGARKPTKLIIGADVAGRVEAVGSGVTRFKPGDEVYGDLSNCDAGAFAEYTAAPEKFLALKPTNLSFEQAAAVPLAATTALQGLRDKAKIQAGDKVLVTGAAGGVGSFGVLLAKYFGAEVTAVCQTSKIDMVRALGADRVVDYTREDVTKMGLRFDVIFDAAAYRPFTDYKPVLAPNGRYVIAGGAISRILRTMLLAPLAARGTTQRFTNISQVPNADDLVTMKSILETGEVVPAIDRCYPLAELPAAMRYFSEGRTRGKIVIVVG